MDRTTNMPFRFALRLASLASAPVIRAGALASLRPSVVFVRLGVASILLSPPRAPLFILAWLETAQIQTQ